MRNKRVMPQDPTRARIRLMTDGLLIQRLKADPLVLQASCIMLDEVHEMNPNMEIILGLLVSVSGSG